MASNIEIRICNNKNGKPKFEDMSKHQIQELMDDPIKGARFRETLKHEVVHHLTYCRFINLYNHCSSLNKTSRLDLPKCADLICPPDFKTFCPLSDRMVPIFEDIDRILYK